MAAPTTRQRRAPKRASAAARRAFFETAGAFTEYLGVACDEGAFVVNTNCRQMGLHLFIKQARPEFRVLRRAVAATKTLLGHVQPLFIDVGANIGTSTVAALGLPEFERAVACEPEPENYRMLCTNLALNGLGDVETLRVAVSSGRGVGMLVVIGGPPGKTWVTTDPEVIRSEEARRAQRVAEDPTLELLPMRVTDVEFTTLDSLAGSGVIDPDEAGMLWIDVEGHEGHVLAGAQTLTERGVPIVFEFEPRTLGNRGDQDGLYEIAEGCYTHFVDLRRTESDRRRFELRQVAELPELAKRWLDPAVPVSFSDLLLLRLEADEVRRGEDLARSIGV